MNKRILTSAQIMKEAKKAIIIGGGLSGLTAGIYLKKYGFDVEILEKNAYMGGLCTGWVRKGSYIDGCIHWLTESNHGELHEVMREIGALGDDVKVTHLEAYSQAVVNGKEVNFYLDPDRFEKELMSFATKNDVPKVKMLIKFVRKFKLNLITAGNPYHLWTLWEKIKFISRIVRLISVFKGGTKLTIEDFANSLESEELRFAFKNTFVPNHYSLFSFANTMGGICDFNSGIPEGGSKAFAQRVVDKFTSLGGKTRTSCPVEKIVIDGDRATGVALKNGEIMSADYVIPACDVHYTQEVLLEKKFTITQIAEAEKEKTDYPSFSLFMVSFRTKKDVSNLNPNRYIKCDEYDVLGEKCNCIYMKHFGYDKTLSTDGQTVVQAYLESSEAMFDKLNAMTHDEYKTFKAEFTAKITEIVEKTVGDEYGELEYLDVCTPITFNKWTNAYKGTFMTHMLSKNSRQIILRNDILPLRNVAMAGHWMMMPGGVPVAIMQGKFAAMSIRYMDQNPNKFDMKKAIQRLHQPLKRESGHSMFKRES